MSNQAQIDADAAMARRLQEQEFESAHHFQFPFRRPSSSSAPPVPPPGAPPYFFQTTMGPGGPSSAARGGGIPDRERTPYAYVRDDQDASHPAANPHLESMARAAAHANAAHARAAHAQAQQAAHDRYPMENMMLDHFSSLFHGAPPPPPRSRRFGSGGRGSAPPGPPNTIPDAMAEMMRHFNTDMPSFFHGPPGGETDGASFYMGGASASDGVPQFFRAMMGGAGGAGTYEEFLDLIERRGNVNRGATDEEIARLPVVKFKPTKKASSASAAERAAGVDGAEKCVICLGEFEEGDELIVLPCGHRFLKDCAKKWLKVNRTCPSCKRSIRPGDTAQQ